ncbi:mitochondrial matrix iron-sulfur protein [Emmonsiellopsis sp. PD_5]|nr:mitochondrial matrix iron-sulfur protein [Emmonsiellopsis sp. PD_5]
MSICSGIARQLRISAPQILSKRCSSLAQQPRWNSIRLAGTRSARAYSIYATSGGLRRYEMNALTQARRRFSSTPVASHGHIEPPKPGEELNITFIDKEGEKHHFQVSKGDNLLDIAQANDLEMEGACGGSCACSTCHVIVENADFYDKMEEPDDDENDMLDLAFGLTETSRLGCQVKMSKELDGLVVRLPTMTRNMQASDFR